jgi:hypothetical protein
MQIELSGKLGTYNSGKKVCGISVTMARDELSVSKAVNLLVNAQLSVQISATPGDDGDGPKLIDNDLTFSGVADVHSLTVRGDDYSFRMSFNKTDCDRDTLESFTCASARLVLERIGQANAPKDAESEDDGD